MAPKKPSSPPKKSSPKREASIDKTKPKRRPKKIPRVKMQKNGLLDMDYRGRYSKKRMHNAQSPLLRLPAEIRNTIYDYTLEDQRIRQKCHDQQHASKADDEDPFALLRNCRQIYAEAALIPYRGNWVVIDSREQLEKLVKSRPAKREALRCLWFKADVKTKDWPVIPGNKRKKAIKLTEKLFPGVWYAHFHVNGEEHTGRAQRCLPCTERCQDLRVVDGDYFEV